MRNSADEVVVPAGACTVGAMTFPRISADKPAKVIPARCTRCFGDGMYGPHVVYSGKCFRCGPTNSPGIDPTVKTWGYPEAWTEAQCAEHAEDQDAKRLARNEKARARKAAKIAAEGQVHLDANAERFPIITEALAIEEPHPIIKDILLQAHRRAISSNQAALVAKLVKEAAEEAQEAAEAPPEAPVPVTDERIEIQGTVLKTVWRDHDFGSSLKMLLLVETPEGAFKLWGSTPKALGRPDNGTKVRFMAKVEVSQDDPSFGFWSRPTKAQEVEV